MELLVIKIILNLLGIIVTSTIAFIMILRIAELIYKNF